MRVACFGIAKKGVGGSVSQAGYLILKEMLERGIEIDFFGWKGYFFPDELSYFSNLTIHEIPDVEWLERLMSKLSGVVHRIATFFLLHPVKEVMSQREILTKFNAHRNYDAVLFLGKYAPFKVESIPVISWLQSAPGTEWFYINKNRALLMKLCGRLIYVKLFLYYVIFKSQRNSDELSNSDVFICGSKWSKENLIMNGVDESKVFPLPYPIEIESFQSVESSNTADIDGPQTVLWLGRIDARKRLDLFLDACCLLIENGANIKVKIVGQPSYGKGYQRLIDKFKYPDRLEHDRFLPYEEVPKILRRSAVLVQPSEGENFGSSPAESICCGTPVVLGPTNGTKDYLGPAGFVFEEYTVDSLKDTIARVLALSKADREKLNLEAKSTAKSMFSSRRIIDELEGIITNAGIGKVKIQSQ
jgi:glycosyltransferase involved in cell wall biosynthesis